MTEHQPEARPGFDPEIHVGWAADDQQPEAPASVDLEAPGDALVVELAGLKAELARVRSGAETLGKIVSWQVQSMEAARIEMIQNGPEAAMEWILNSIPDVDDNDPEDQWNGTETAREWLDRTASAYRVTAAAASEEKAPAVPSPPVAAVLDREALGRIVHETRCAENAKKDRPFVLEPWERRAPSQQELDMKIAEAVAAAVRERSDEEGPDRG